ncbi:phage tail sheath family protein [Enterocloster citroniae]|uniref:phage tail sheath family protein n=1 Tax=Enterocloster citroniae TaxID=358743 RepID=UPI0032C03557
MLGGGSFISLNKVLPGAYINFVSVASSVAVLSERGTAAIPLEFGWGPEKEAFVVTAQDYQEKCQEIFGYPADAPQMWQIRELFKNLTKGIFYRLNGGIKASCDYGEARYSGIRGKDLTLVVNANVNDSAKYDVKTLLDMKEVDRQTVASAAELADNLYVVFKKDATLAATAGVPFTGGTNGDAVTGEDYAQFLSKMETYSFQVLCCPSADEAVKSVFVEYTKRMRDEAGVKFQTVMYRKNDADYEGIISVENKAAELEQGLVYWTTGAQAACAVNKTNENRVYNGELNVDVDHTQGQLAAGVQSGKFMFHRVGDDVRVLMDINTLTTFTEEKGKDFSSNQTVRVLDQIGNDIASMFNTKYLGIMPNDDAGRVSLWNDIVTYNKELARLRAIEAVEAKDITVGPGESKRAVVVNCPVTPINCMSQLYMTVVVS